MGTKRRPQHVEVVLEHQETDALFSNSFIVAARDLASLDESQKVAKQLATAKPGTAYYPCRLWPGVLAQEKTTVEFVDPDRAATSF